MRKPRSRRRDAASRVFLSVALGFGATVASSVVFPESPTLRVFAADEAREALLSDAESTEIETEFVRLAEQEGARLAAAQKNDRIKSGAARLNA